MTLEDISRLCRVYADARNRLAAVVDTVKEEQRRAVRARLRSIRSGTAVVAAAKANLEQALKDGKSLFERPRTRALEEVVVGWRKMPGRVEIPDEDRTIVKMEKNPALAKLVQVKKIIDKAALRHLDARTLASVGVSLTDTTDVVVIKVAHGDVDKLVEALLDDVGEELDIG